jgi:hypothetical protein
MDIILKYLLIIKINSHIFSKIKIKLNLIMAKIYIIN